MVGAAGFAGIVDFAGSVDQMQIRKALHRLEQIEQALHQKATSNVVREFVDSRIANFDMPSLFTFKLRFFAMLTELPGACILMGDYKQ